MPSAANEPTGRMLTETMKATVRTSLIRASRRWTTLARAR
jgi:hypothetical protein